MSSAAEQYIDHGGQPTSFQTLPSDAPDPMPAERIYQVRVGPFARVDYRDATAFYYYCHQRREREFVYKLKRVERRG